MKKINQNFFTLTNNIYNLLVINLLFLLFNILFFQTFFHIDFNYSTLPLYFIVSQTIIPTTRGLLKSRYSSIIEKNSVNTRKIIKNIMYSFSNHWKTWILISFVLYIPIINLYILVPNSLFSSIVYLGNMGLLIINFLFVINTVLVSLNDNVESLFKKSIATFIANTKNNLGLLILNVSILAIAFRLTFVAIIIIFGVLIEINIHLLSRKEMINNGISNS